MLQITVPAVEGWDEKREEFVQFSKEQVLALEHSLVSISKWESKWHKPYFSKEPKSTEELIDYIRCMTITQNVDPQVYVCLTPENISDINEYMDDPMTATWFNEEKEQGESRVQTTSELVYYNMIAYNIPFECQKWHFNRLMTLIKICEIKNRPPKKKNTREIMQHHAALNAKRRKQLNTRG